MKTTFMRKLDELNAFSGLADVLHNKKITDKDRIKAKSLFIEGLIRFLELYGNNEIGNVEVDIRKVALWVNSCAFENKDVLEFTNLNRVYKYIENCLYNNIPLFRFLKLSKYQFNLMENAHREQMYKDYETDCETYPCLKCIWYNIRETPFGNLDNCYIKDNPIKNGYGYGSRGKFYIARHKNCKYCTTLTNIPSVITESKYFGHFSGISQEDIERARKKLKTKIDNLDNSTIPISISESEYVSLDYINNDGVLTDLLRVFNYKKTKTELLHQLRQAILLECFIKFMDIYAETEIGNNYYANITNITKYVYKNYVNLRFTSIRQAYEMIENLITADFNDKGKLIKSFVKYKDK